LGNFRHAEPDTENWRTANQIDPVERYLPASFFSKWARLPSQAAGTDGSYWYAGGKAGNAGSNEKREFTQRREEYVLNDSSHPCSRVMIWSKKIVEALDIPGYLRGREHVFPSQVGAY
jgi:hypothetical protein